MTQNQVIVIEKPEQPAARVQNVKEYWTDGETGESIAGQLGFTMESRSQAEKRGICFRLMFHISDELGQGEHTIPEFRHRYRAVMGLLEPCPLRDTCPAYQNKQGQLPLISSILEEE